MKLTDAFERVVILNLPFKSERRERLTRHLNELDLVDWSKVVWQRAICGDWTGHPSWWSAGNGAWGCLMSHVRACEDAIHDQLANYLVLEDDVIFHRRAASMLDELMHYMPEEWGQIYLGGQYLHREPVVVEETEGKVLKPYNVNRTHAFALQRGAFAPFLQHVLHAPDYMDYTVAEDGFPKLCGNHFHIDHQLGRAHERETWQVYSPPWWLAGQAEGSSNVSGRLNSEMWWHWRERGLKLPFVLVPKGVAGDDLARAKQLCHFGWNTVPSTARDRGLTRALSAGTLRPFLEMIAGEAIERWLLPGVEVTDDEATRIKEVWPWTVDNAEACRDYPFADPFQGVF